MNGLAGVCAPAVGPPLGGYITDHFDWRWIFFLNVPICILSLWLTNRIVEDPPWVKKQVAISQKGGIKLDLIGFSLLAMTFGSLEFILDKGQEDDWLASPVIAFFLVLMVIAFFTMIWWELKQLRENHRPIVNLTLFKRRTFAISFMLMAMMPIVGFLSSKVDPRKLMAFGFTTLTLSLIWMAHLNLGLSYGQLVFMRMFQASGLAFLFIPINTIAYVGVKQTESNDVSGLTNLARNIGGSCGTAFLATMLIRRTATHENNMVRNLTPGNPAFMDPGRPMAPRF